MNVVTAQSAAQRRTIMTTFTIDEQNNIPAHGTPEEAAAATATPFDSFASQKELAELVAAWTAERLVAIWNSLPGVTPAKKFKDRTTAISRIWERIQGLGEAAKPKEERKAKGGAAAAKGAPAKAKATKKATGAKKAPKAKKAAKAQETTGPRVGSKTAQVVGISSARTAPRWRRSWTRWAGRSTPSAGSWPAR
jgi:hypothetical protein